jgi:alpha-tubulin suppressor-like RCC1 family protein
MSCWGAGAAGQRGDGESGSAVLATSTPAPELSGSSWRAVSAGLTHTCGIKTDGSLWCWGEGGDGQLGTGSTSQSDVAVRESSNATWLSVDCGDNHTCGIQADGSLWCWGRNDRGQLGNDTRTSSSVPVRENSMKSWKRVSAGSSHTCGIRTDGALWCWGAGAAGQLGDGRAQTDNTIPVQENSASEWTTVVTGASHTCGLKTDRSLWCWGSNGSGQLGTGSVSTSQPEQEQLKALWGP